MEKEIGSLSSRLLEMLHIKGKVTDLSPAAGPCEVGGLEGAEFRSVRHPWSLYGPDNSTLEKGMRNLVERLPRQGWKVVRNGPDSSKNRNQEILAVHLRTHTQAEVTWMKGLDGHTPIISFAVYSRCFRDPDAPGASPTDG
ncbi:hypothetical protein ACZ90_56725 [Streptomyces albus subsp. albus]|nr:hypothetical protein ACZ90_56725 [Streptomyces albus subsp. albus]